MTTPPLEPEVYPLDYGAQEVEARQVLEAFRLVPDLTRRPRNPEKAAWLRSQGIDPDKAIPR